MTARIAFAGSPVDRADHIRSDPAALEGLMDWRARLLRLDGLDPVFSPEGTLEWGTLADAAVMLMSIWQGVGFQMLVFLAGLQAIPGDLYEAATLDGAKPWNQFRFITLPLLKNTTVFVLVTTGGGSAMSKVTVLILEVPAGPVAL